MSSDGNTNRPLPSLILLGIVDFCCILIGLEQVSAGKIATGAIWIFVGISSGLIGYYWTQIKKVWNRLVASVRSRTEPSKLVIHWANYRAIENNGDVYEVGDFLQQIISGDSLVVDIENHNFVVGDKNFVPHDPLPFKMKRLQVNYSYRGQPAITVTRQEHGRLVLPEDSAIPWLKSEIDRLKAALPKQSKYPIPEVRLKILSIVSELQGFLGEHGEEPRPPEIHKELGEDNLDFLARFRARPVEPMMKWRARFLGDYRREFKNKVSSLRDEMRSMAHIDDSRLNIAVERAENESNDCVAAVQGVIERFWELALKVNV
jgi:hypothetical protein